MIRARNRRVIGILWLVLASCGMLRAQDPAGTGEAETGAEAGTEEDFLDVAFEDLLQIEVSVTSVTRSAASLLQTPAAIHVLTREDIRRSGLDEIPELLRRVPGVHVFRLGASRWGLGIRGFGGELSNNVLVRIDGRTINSPFFTGVDWDSESPLLEDVERIEIVRGPAAAILGQNAVNGVVNIITRSAHDTKGGFFSLRTGTHDEYRTSLRYGFDLGGGASARVFAKGFSRNGNVEPSGDNAFDDWEHRRAGFRVDWDLSPEDSLKVSGEIYHQESEFERFHADVPTMSNILRRNVARSYGWNLLGQWNRELSPTSELQFRLAYDGRRRSSYGADIDSDILDLDFQHQSAPAEGHELVWGLGYRLVADDFDTNPGAILAPSSRNAQLFTAFVRYRLPLVEDRLSLDFSTKLEHDEYNDFEVQPSVRLSWTPDARQIVWASASRGVRTQTRAEQDASFDQFIRTLPGPPGTVLIRALGSEDFDAETVISIDVGYRGEVTENLSLEVSGFFSFYEDLTTLQAGMPFPDVVGGTPIVVSPQSFDNLRDAESFGFEVSFGWTAASWLRLSGHYSFIQITGHELGSSTEPYTQGPERMTPHHLAHLLAEFRLTEELHLQTAAYYNDSAPDLDAESHLRLDAILQWNPCPDVSVTAGVTNILDDRHPEGTSEILEPRETERTFFIGVEIDF